MATNINTILSWFMTGKKPTQAQFSASWTSFWHKEEVIPQSAVSNLTATLNAKAEKSQFDAHKVDANAHAELFNLKEDKVNKGQPNGYAPLNNVAKIISSYLIMVNDLVTGGTNPLTAEQGKILQDQINAINILLGSDDINLDTVQEIVDKIKEIQSDLDSILVNDLVTGGVTKALTAEMGKVLNLRLSALEVKQIPEDFYIAGLIDSSSLLYKSGNDFKNIDLQPFSTITIVNTNEIVRNGNDFFISGNFTFDNTGQAFIARLSNCYLDLNGNFKFTESNFEPISTAVHSLLFHNGFLFLTSRTTQTKVLKINPYNLADQRSLLLPNDANYGGQTTDILGYQNKVYILVTIDWAQTSKLIEIDDSLLSYKQVFNIPSVAGYNTGQTSPFLIYNDELYVPFYISTTQVAVRVYNLQGHVVRQRSSIVINASGTGVATPHWMGIFNNKLLITYANGRSLLRLDCNTLATEESIALESSITDDNSISKDGYVYLNGEYNPYDPTAPAKLFKIKYNNFADKTILLEGAGYNNGKGSYGSINNKVNVSSLNVFEKKNNNLNKNANYQIVMSDFPNNNCLVVFADATAGSFTITLPTAVSTSGYEVKVVKTDVSANTVTLKGSGAELINASNTQILAAQYDKITTKSNGVQNYII